MIMQLRYIILLIFLFLLMVLLHGVFFLETNMDFIVAVTKYQWLWFLYYVVAHVISKIILKKMIS